MDHQILMCDLGRLDEGEEVGEVMVLMHEIFLSI